MKRQHCLGQPNWKGELAPERGWDDEIDMRMRRYFATAAIGALASMSCGSCANNQSSTASANANPAAKTYTSDDLARTGKRDAGEALRAADPSVTTTGR
jgi:hypothetical protein